MSGVIRFVTVWCLVLVRWLDRLLCGLSGHDYLKDFSKSDDTVIRLHGVCIKCGHCTKGWSWPRTKKVA